MEWTDFDHWSLTILCFECGQSSLLSFSCFVFCFFVGFGCLVGMGAPRVGCGGSSGWGLRRAGWKVLRSFVCLVSLVIEYINLTLFQFYFIIDCLSY